MAGQVVTLTNGQTYSTSVADTILAGAGSETVTMSGAGAILFGAVGTNVSATYGTAVLPTGQAALYIVGDNVKPATVFAGSAAGAFQSYGAVSTSGSGTTISGGGADDIWAGTTNLFVSQPGGSSREAIVAGNNFVFGFDAGSSSSTISAAASNFTASPANSPIDASGTAYVGDGGMLTVIGESRSVTTGAGAGSNTINGAAATGASVFVASTGNTSLIGGGGNDFFVVGSGADTIVAGSAAATLVVVSGHAGGSDVVQNWSAADQIYLFGYGSSGVTSQQAVGGSLQLRLSDQSLITLSGVPSISSAQIHAG